MVHTVDTNIILHLVGASCDTTFSGWVVSGTGTDSVLSNTICDTLSPQSRALPVFHALT